MMPSVSNMSNIWKMNPCHLCDSQFPGPILLKRHMQVKHRSQTTSSTEKRKSPITSSIVSLKGKVARREGLNSPGGKGDPVLQCSYCQHQARSVTGLARHTTGHTGSRKCSKCQKGYAQGSSSSEHYLKLHEASCTGEPKWLSASPGHQEAASTPTSLRNEQEIQTLPAMETEYSDQPHMLGIQVKSEDIKSSPMVVKEEKVTARNIKFEAYISSQALHNVTELKPVVPLYSYNQPLQPLQPLQPQQPIQPKQEQDTGLDETVPENRKQERTQFGPKGKRYEKYWCMGCENWLNGGKGSVSGHLRKKHEEEDCQVIMITNQGMLKVDKEDFLPAKKM